MEMPLKTAIHQIWKPDFERKGIQSEFKPVFTRYIGVEDVNEYPNILKTLKTRSDDCSCSVMFDGSVPMQAEFEIISYVGQELKTMDVTKLDTQDIELFEDTTRNAIFLKALAQIVNLALKQETFFNDSVRNDFILKLIVWTYSYIRPMQFKLDVSPKCIYYGDITKHEVYFLMMLHLMAFDVLFLNPLREEMWDVETLGISSVHKNMQIVPIETLEAKIRNADVIDCEESITLQYEREVEDMMAGTGAYRPWQFRDGDVKPIFTRLSIHDIGAMWGEPARVRNGFKVSGKTVTVPNIFFEIDGMESQEEYADLIQLCTSQPNTYVLKNGAKELVQGTISNEQKLQFSFCMNFDGTINIKEVQKLPFYEWDRYRDSLEELILRKVNVLFSDKMFKKELNQQDKFDILADVLSINPQIIRMADGFDYTGAVPKLVVFLENDDYIEDRMLYIIGFIWQLGFDIMIFCPSGLVSIDSVFELNRFNCVRLENMVYDMTLEKAKKKKKGLFGKFFS